MTDDDIFSRKFTVVFADGKTKVTFTYRDYLKAMESIDLGGHAIDDEETIAWLQEKNENRLAAYITVVIWQSKKQTSH
jgi:hypothetical protein